jgi:hypothetical protein
MLTNPPVKLYNTMKTHSIYSGEKQASFRMFVYRLAGNLFLTEAVGTGKYNHVSQV